MSSTNTTVQSISLMARGFDTLSDSSIGTPQHPVAPRAQVPGQRLQGPTLVQCIKASSLHKKTFSSRAISSLLGRVLWLSFVVRYPVSVLNSARTAGERPPALPARSHLQRAAPMLVLSQCSSTRLTASATGPLRVFRCTVYSWRVVRLPSTQAQSHVTSKLPTHMRERIGARVSSCIRENPRQPKSPGVLLSSRGLRDRRITVGVEGRSVARCSPERSSRYQPERGSGSW
jgi:hypothetical protein